MVRTLGGKGKHDVHFARYFADSSESGEIITVKLDIIVEFSYFAEEMT